VFELLRDKVASSCQGRRARLKSAISTTWCRRSIPTRGRSPADRSPCFPGWESFATLIERLKFVRDHRRKICRIAAMTDSSFLKYAPKIGAHFVQPETQGIRQRRES